MTAVQLFLIAWPALSLQQCISLTPGSPDHAPAVFFGGACTDAITYANQVGGWWQFWTPGVPVVS
jgi:hypothetical protein